MENNDDVYVWRPDRRAFVYFLNIREYLHVVGVLLALK